MTGSGNAWMLQNEMALQPRDKGVSQEHGSTGSPVSLHEEAKFNIQIIKGNETFLKSKPELQ